jgi:hypothetical protein
MKPWADFVFLAFFFFFFFFFCSCSIVWKKLFVHAFFRSCHPFLHPPPKSIFE